MRVLVTGASGGLGRFLVDRLLADRRVERLTLMARRTEALPTGDKIDSCRAIFAIRRRA